MTEFSRHPASTPLWDIFPPLAILCVLCCCPSPLWCCTVEGFHLSPTRHVKSLQPANEKEQTRQQKVVLIWTKSLTFVHEPECAQAFVKTLLSVWVFCRLYNCIRMLRINSVRANINLLKWWVINEIGSQPISKSSLNLLTKRLREEGEGVGGCGVGDGRRVSCARDRIDSTSSQGYAKLLSLLFDYFSWWNENSLN